MLAHGGTNLRRCQFAEIEPYHRPRPFFHVNLFRSRRKPAREMASLEGEFKLKGRVGFGSSLLTFLRSSDRLLRQPPAHACSGLYRPPHHAYSILAPNPE
jgi:hypothetical protein